MQGKRATARSAGPVRLRVTPDGSALDPPGGGRPFLACAVEAPGRTAVLVEAPETPVGTAGAGLPVVAILDQPPTRALAADLVVMGPGLTAGGALAPPRVSRLRRVLAPALVAAPLREDAPWETRPVDAVIIDGGVAGDARTALGAVMRAAGRAALLDVRDGALSAEAIVGVLDLGAAGALVRTGNARRDAELVAAVDELDARRLDTAPLMSVIICNHNSARYLDRCLASLADLRYPQHEVIVVDDGSTDESPAIASRHPHARLVSLDRVGLSAARNAGAREARGEVLVYIDGDTEVEPHLLARLWRLLDRLQVDAASGPNLPFPEAGFQERVVAASPGGNAVIADPDGTATSLTGCNMAFRRAAYERAGGFDDSIRGAYDDIDFSLRFTDAGGTMAYHPTATVFHHRRDSIAGYLRQQRAWGSATSEAFESRHGDREHAGGSIVAGRRGLGLLRIGTDDLRHVFDGPQAEGRYLLSTQPLHVGLPLKALTALAAIAVLTAPPALWLGRSRMWLISTAGATVALFGVVAARVPLQPATARSAAVPERAAAAGLWFAQPAVRRLSALQGRLRRGDN